MGRRTRPCWTDAPLPPRSAPSSPAPSSPAPPRQCLPPKVRPRCQRRQHDHVAGRRVDRRRRSWQRVPRPLMHAQSGPRLRRHGPRLGFLGSPALAGTVTACLATIRPVLRRACLCFGAGAASGAPPNPGIGPTSARGARARRSPSSRMPEKRSSGSCPRAIPRRSSRRFARAGSRSPTAGPCRCMRRGGGRGGGVVVVGLDAGLAWTASGCGLRRAPSGCAFVSPNPGPGGPLTTSRSTGRGRISRCSPIS